MCVAIVINANSVLHMLCIYILWEEPTSTDLMGKQKSFYVNQYVMNELSHLCHLDESTFIFIEASGVIFIFR